MDPKRILVLAIAVSLVVGALGGYFGAQGICEKKISKARDNALKELEADMDKAREEVLMATIPNLRKYTAQYRPDQEVNNKYFKSFSITTGQNGMPVCIYKFKNESSYGDLKPRVKLKFFDKYGFCIGESSSFWVIQSIHAGQTREEVEDIRLSGNKTKVAFFSLDMG